VKYPPISPGNIESAVKLYTGKNIPVIIFEPVCNLLDMPPFSGEKDNEFVSFIKEYDKIIQSKNPRLVKTFYQERTKRIDLNNNANIIYLDGLAKKIMGDPDYAADLIHAKDLDTVPFRARSEIVNALRQFVQTNNNKNLYYIPTFSVLTNKLKDLSYRQRAVF